VCVREREIARGGVFRKGRDSVREKRDDAISFQKRRENVREMMEEKGKQNI